MSDRKRYLNEQTFLAIGEAIIPRPDESAKQRVRDRLMEFVTSTHDPLHITRAEDGEWEFLQQGVHIKRLYVDPDTKSVTALWRLDPGTEVETHFHDADEECLVLEGDLRIGGSTLKAGDFLLGPKGSTHPRVLSRGGALLLIRAQDYRSAAQALGGCFTV